MILHFLDYKLWVAAYTFILYAITSTVRAVPEPVPPGFETGNYHDPRAAIECIPTPPDSSSNLQLCAKPGYGGFAAANAGGYCNWRQWDVSSVFLQPYATLTFEPTMSTVQFDATVEQIKCNAVCWCRERPNTGLPFDQTYPLRPPVSPILLSLPNMWPLTPGTQPHALTFDGKIMARPINVMPERDVYADSPERLSRYWAATYGGNSAITCQGIGSNEAVPTISASGQFIWPWLTEHQICAAEQWGGFPWGNAGGYCLNGIKYFSPIIAHPRLTLRTEMGRLWMERCRRHCTCAIPVEPPDIIGDRVLKIRATHLLKDLMAQHMNTFDTIEQLQVIIGSLSSRPDRARSSRGLLQPDGSRPRTSPPMLGQKEEAPRGRRRKAIPGRPQTDAIQAPGTCGGLCDSPRNCSQTGAGSGPLSHSCTCVADPSMVQVQAAGLDPVFPHAACFPAVGLSSAGGFAAAFGLDKRGGLAEQDSGVNVASSWPCVCNATYVSRACCGSSDGVVWEDVGGKLGRLAV